MMKRTADTSAPIFEATSLALEPTSSPSRLVSDPMLAEISDPLHIDGALVLPSLSSAEVDQWFIDEPPNGENFSMLFASPTEITPHIGCDLHTSQAPPYSQLIDAENLIRTPVITAPRIGSQPLSPSPLADVKIEERSEYGEDASVGTGCTVNYSPVPISMQSSQPANSLGNAKVVKRGRPMKITSRSKQALYAREYRRKNKQALWEYERRVRDQDEEITRLRRQNEQMQLKLAKLIHMKDAIAKHRGPYYDEKNAPLQVTLADILSRSSTQQLIGASKKGAFCVHVCGDHFSVLSCETCNIWNGAGDDGMKPEEINEGIELFNGDFNEIKHFIR